MPDCGASGCIYAKKRSGMRAVSSCKCDSCPHCGQPIKPNSPRWHRDWCKMRAWVPPHHRGKGIVVPPLIITIHGISPAPLRAFTVKPTGTVSLI